MMVTWHRSLTHPKFLKKKIYHVTLDKNVTRADLDTIVSGVTLEDGEVHADAAEYASEESKSEVGIEIHSGKNRIVRRIFESLGYKVIKLDRVFFAGLTKKGLRRGEWRYLTEKSSTSFVWVLSNNVAVINEYKNRIVETCSTTCLYNLLYNRMKRKFYGKDC
jgi:16S rRNA U516 pseudouridylate synthase RsuA-like enzyme